MGSEVRYDRRLTFALRLNEWKKARKRLFLIEKNVALLACK